MISLAVVRGIGTIARVALKVPVGAFGYCCAMGFGWLLVEHVPFVVECVDWAAVWHSQVDNKKAATANM